MKLTNKEVKHLKRSIFGTYHHFSVKHMGRYLREREFHWN